MAVRPLAPAPGAADDQPLLVHGLRVGDVEEGVHRFAWALRLRGAAMEELSHRTGPRGRVQTCVCAVRRSARCVWRPAPAVRPAAPGCYDPPMPAAYTSELAEALADDVLDRFLRYVRVDTQSVRDRKASPSTPGQLDLSRMLVAELLEIGLEDASLDSNGYVFATLPPPGARAPRAVGLIAHVDVSPDAPGAGVEPVVHRAYDGARIELPRGGTVLDPAAMPVLASKRGHDVVTASGDTLLGADDKAGVAEIMAAVAHLAAHPELPRPTLRVGFTPDEEVGEGATLFDVERFGAACAYTLDG